MIPIVITPRDGGIAATPIECRAVELLLGLAMIDEPNEKFACTIRQVYGDLERARARRVGRGEPCDEPA